MSDENPKSLLFLCDDTIREILSYMPLKSRVRHSGTCAALYQVVDQSLHSVTKLTSDEQGGMSLTRDDKYLFPKEFHFKSRLKTLSKLKNLSSVFLDLMLHPKETDDVISVLADNCHYVREIGLNWYVEDVVLFVTKLMEKGVPVRLKKIRNIDTESAEEVKLAMTLIQTTDLKLVIVEKDFPFIQKTGCWDRVIEVDYISDCYNMPLQSMASVEKLGRISLKEGDEYLVKRILQSMPRLKDLRVFFRGSPDKLFQMLAEADQDFEGLGLLVEYSPPGKEGVDYLKRLMESKGKNLRSLDIEIDSATRETVIHVLHLIGNNCPRLKSFQFHEVLMNGLTCGQCINYRNHRLSIDDWRGVPLSHLLRIIPNVRKVFIAPSATMRHGDVQLMSELREFASGQKKYCIIVEVAQFGGAKTIFLS